MAIMLNSDLPTTPEIRGDKGGMQEKDVCM